MNDERDIVDAIGRLSSRVGWVAYWLLLIFVALFTGGCPKVHAAPLLPPLPEPAPSLQYWHTVDIPRDGGVYPLEVFAPALPPIIMCYDGTEFTSIGDPPAPPVHVPEPGTAMLVITAIVVSAVWQLVLWIERKEKRLWMQSAARANMLAERYTAGFNRMSHALRKIENVEDLRSAQAIARKALEE